MGILGQKSKIKAAPQTIRVEKVLIPQKQNGGSSSSHGGNSNNRARPTSHPSSSSNNGLRVGATGSRTLSPNPRGVSRTKSASPYPSSADERMRGGSSGNKRKKAGGGGGAGRSVGISGMSTPRDSPAFGDSTDDDGDGDDDPFSTRNKRLRRSASVDVNRKLRHKKAFGDEDRDSHIIHAADIASVATGCPPILGAQADAVAVELQYPSRCKPERWVPLSIHYRAKIFPDACSCRVTTTVYYHYVVANVHVTSQIRAGMEKIRSTPSKISSPLYATSPIPI